MPKESPGERKSLCQRTVLEVSSIDGWFNWVLVVPAGSPEVVVPSMNMGALGQVGPGFEFSSNFLTQFPQLQNGN